MLGEDVENQLGAIDDACGQSVFEPALLGGAQLVVDEQGLGPGLLELRLQLVQLPLAHVAALIGFRATLDELADRLHARGTRELAQLSELVGFVDARSQHGDDESPLRLRARGGIWLACHD
jgi:hypothetical protein